MATTGGMGCTISDERWSSIPKRLSRSHINVPRSTGFMRFRSSVLRKGRSRRFPLLIFSAEAAVHKVSLSPKEQDAHSSGPDVSSCHLDRSKPRDLLHMFEKLPMETLMSESARLRDEGFGNVVTFSPKVFIPVTRLCRDSCGYCTFAQPPMPGRRCYMTMEEILDVARAGAMLGCCEALLTLGDKPELKYAEAKAELRDMGYSSTIDYVYTVAENIAKKTGLLPHINAGVMTMEDLEKFRGVSASQGVMLESLSTKLLEAGGPHYECPDKVPDKRLGTLEAAGEAKVPFTTGILIGIGETRLDRLEALLAIKHVHERHGHIQEIIIQNFRAKKGTAMQNAVEPSLEELLWTIAVARTVLGPKMSIQAPPNLTPSEDDISSSDAKQESSNSDIWKAMIDAGINDWGGVSPLTRDFVNPEKPWPHLSQLASATARAGKHLVPRLPVTPNYVDCEWIDSKNGKRSMFAAVLRQSDAFGLYRASSWYAGTPSTSNVPEEKENSDGDSNEIRNDEKNSRPAVAAPLTHSRKHRWHVSVDREGVLEGTLPPPPSPEIARVLTTIVSSKGYELSEEEIVLLFSARGADFEAVVHAADSMRKRMHGDRVTYVVNRNINYTNVCTYSCQFCAFSKGKNAESLRGAPYLLPLEEVTKRAADAWRRGATEVCMQGGIHPDFTGDTYLRLLRAAKDAHPDLHVHAFSPLEVKQGADTLGWSLVRFLSALRDEGLGSLPGTAAEVLSKEVREKLCPDKISSEEWLEIVEAAHSVGLKTTSTIMFGHVDGPHDWAKHLIALRDLQKRTGGFSEFVPLPFVHMEAPIYHKGQSRAGPTLKECVLMHAIGRLVLSPFIENIQASWVKMGPFHAAELLNAGCNDMGGVLMNESITRAAGASYGQELGPHRMHELIRNVGRVPAQRTTLYQDAPKERVHASYAAAGG